MAKNFTLKKYEELLLLILYSDYHLITVNDYFSCFCPEPWIIIRHDVDRRPECALRIAEIENKYGIFTTYYFRVPFKEKILNKIGAMGHEIGFHYENNSQWPKNMPRITTCSPHTKSKRCLIGLYDAKNVVAGKYITDTGRCIKKYNYNDFAKTDNSDNLYLNLHPERWNDGIMWYYQYVFDFIINKLKRVFYESSFNKSTI